MIRCTQVITRNTPAEFVSRGECQADKKAAETDLGMSNDTTSAADTITLDQTSRHRRRMKMVSDRGIAFLLDLAEATQLRDGDQLLLDDARCILVKAESEALYEVRGHNSQHLLSLTWHMGNRHLSTQIMKDHLRIRRDPVIARMLEQLGGEVRNIEAAFDPQGGAYGGSAAPTHDSSHEQSSVPHSRAHHASVHNHPAHHDKDSLDKDHDHH